MWMWIKLLIIFIILIVVLLTHVFCEKQQPEGRIAGGHDAKHHVPPYIVSLQKNNLHHCGGTIIDENLILTAAHCITSQQDAKNIKIYAGVYDLKSIKNHQNLPSSSNDIQVRGVDRYIRHKLYTGGATPYDIALIRVNQPFTMTETVRPVKLSKSNVELNEIATLYGWGSISKTEIPSYPDKLQTTKVRTISNDECKMALKNRNIKIDIHSTHLCTMGDPLLKLSSPIEFLNLLCSQCDCGSVCNGDSGGPLVNENDELIGVVSWGIIPCGQCDAPSVYARVPSFIKWIEDTKQILNVKN